MRRMSPASGRSIRASAFIGTSLDGFIARPDGSLDWLMGANDEAPPEDLGYDAFVATVDVIVLGRATYDKVRTFPAWPYAKLPVRVLTTRPLEIPDELAPWLGAMSGAPAQVLATLERQGHRHAYVDGGRTIQGFLRAGCLDRIVVTRVPVLIGQGIPLFGPLDRDVALRHVETRALGGGALTTS